MPGEIDIVARMLAFAQGRAVPVATTLQVAIHENALVLAPVAMAGEDTTIHAVALGRVGEPPLVLSVPDPRFRDDQYVLFRQLGEVIEEYFDEQLRAGEYPQVWVSSEAAASLLDVLADRFRFNKQDEAVQRFGTLLAYGAERRPVAGQQALLTATGALGLHLATGQQVGEDEHLGALLAWVEPPQGVPILDAVEAAEQVPMGARTSPTFDRDVLEPLVTRYNESRRAQAPAVVLENQAQVIHAALEPVVTAIYHGIQTSIAALGALELPALAGIEELEAREWWEFSDFMRSRASGYPVPLRDSAKAATHKLITRENAEENHAAARLHGDRVEQARAAMDGHVLIGVVESVQAVKVTPRKTIYTVTVRSGQQVLRVRPRDELCWLGDPRLAFLVRRVGREGGESLVELELTAGMKAVGVPAAGDALELGPGGPDWQWIISQRKQTRARLAEAPWTHERGGALPERRPREGSGGEPADLVAAVEALR